MRRRWPPPVAGPHPALGREPCQKSVTSAKPPSSPADFATTNRRMRLSVPDQPTAPVPQPLFAPGALRCHAFGLAADGSAALLLRAASDEERRGDEALRARCAALADAMLAARDG